MPKYENLSKFRVWYFHIKSASVRDIPILAGIYLCWYINIHVYIYVTVRVSNQGFSQIPKTLFYAWLRAIYDS